MYSRLTHQFFDIFYGLKKCFFSFFLDNWSSCIPLSFIPLNQPTYLSLCALRISFFSYFPHSLWGRGRDNACWTGGTSNQSTKHNNFALRFTSKRRGESLFLFFQENRFFSSFCMWTFKSVSMLCVLLPSTGGGPLEKCCPPTPVFFSYCRGWTEFFIGTLPLILLILLVLLFSQIIIIKLISDPYILKNLGCVPFVSSLLSCFWQQMRSNLF